MAEVILNVQIKARIENSKSVFSQTIALTDQEPVEIIQIQSDKGNFISYRCIAIETYIFWKLIFFKVGGIVTCL